MEAGPARLWAAARDWGERRAGPGTPRKEDDEDAGAVAL